MTLDLDKLRALCEKATPGPWKAHDSHGLYVASHDALHDPDDEFECVADLSPDDSCPGWHGKPADAAFIAAAREAVPALLDEVERLRSILHGPEHEAMRAETIHVRGELEKMVVDLRTALREALFAWSNCIVEYENSLHPKANVSTNHDIMRIAELRKLAGGEP